MSGVSLSNFNYPTFHSVGVDFSSVQYCYKSNCITSIEDKFIELDKVHSIIECSKYKKSSKEEKRNKMSQYGSSEFRPRGALARTLYKKYQNDCKLSEINKYEWYQCNISTLSHRMSNHFLQLSPDAETREFIANAIEKSSWVWTQIWHCIAKSILSFFMTRTDINGWLGRGSMFVLSLDQMAHLLNRSNFLTHRRDNEPCSLVDVGAGDGEVSVIWRKLFTDMYATEMSKNMRNLLQTKGFAVLDTEDWWRSTEKFDVVCMLNLLDRCSEPIPMLASAKEAVKEDGLVIIALVLPYKPYVEYEPSHQPSEPLPIYGKTFEEQLESFVEFVEYKIGLNLVLWSKVPYLCEGDIDQSYYWLNDAVFVFRKN